MVKVVSDRENGENEESTIVTIERERDLKLEDLGLSGIPFELWW